MNKGKKKRKKTIEEKKIENIKKHQCQILISSNRIKEEEEEKNMIVERNINKPNLMMMINPTLIKNDRYSSNRIARNKEQVIGATMIVEQWTHTQV